MLLCVNLFTFKSLQTLCKNKQSQFGFRENNLTSENLLILKSVINKYIHKNNFYVWGDIFFKKYIDRTLFKK